MIINERPGVYTSYVVAESRYKRISSRTCGIAAVGDGDGEIIHTVRSFDEAVSIFGADSNMTKLIRILMENGVAEIKAVPIGTASVSAYDAAFALLGAEEDVKAIICDSALSAVAAALKDTIESADVKAAHKIGIVECLATTPSGFVTAAELLNCERMVLAAPAALDMEGETAVTGSLSAAIAGAILTMDDPAIPLNGAVLRGIGGVTQRFSDTDINTLVRGGVMPVETSGGETTIIRGITTKSMSGGVPDATWRELNTVLIVDDVIPTVRDALKESFMRSKNTAQTRGAIRTKVMIELEKKVAAEIIESYGDITVSASPDDPTVCLVTFDFTVVHGINHICLTAYITV